MSLLSNPNVIRMGIYSTWSSTWYENNPIYSTLIYTDLYINEFLNGIYYKLKMPTTLPTIREIGYDQIIITTKSFVSFKKRRATIKKTNTYLNLMKLRHRRIVFFLRRALRKIKLWTYYKRNKYFVKNESYLYNLNKISEKKRINKKKYINYIQNIKDKIRERRKRLNKIKKYVKKIIVNKLENVKENKIKEKIKSFNVINKQIKKKIIYRNRRKNQIYKYKRIIKGHIKYRINKKLRRISRKRAIRRKLFFKKWTVIKKKYRNKKNMKEVMNTLNRNIILFNWLIMKINQWFFILILKSIITLNMIVGNNEKQQKKENNKFIFNIQNEIKKNIEIKRKDIIERIKKIRYLLLRINKINSFEIKTIIPFKKEIKKNKLYIREKLYNYMRIKSYYRRKRRMEREKRAKELALRFPPKFYNINVRLFKTIKKWTSLYYKKLCYKQLQIKIKDTLSKYMHKNIIFVPSYKRGNLPIIDSPKLLGDYIKLLMKYEQKNPTILKKVVMNHSKQKKKQRNKSYNNIRKLISLRKKVIHKLRKNNKLINVPFKYRGKINNKIRNYKKIIFMDEKKGRINIFKYKIKNKQFNNKYLKLKKNIINNIIGNNIILNYNKLLKLRKVNSLFNLKKINKKNKKVMLSIYNKQYRNKNNIINLKGKRIKNKQIYLNPAMKQNIISKENKKINKKEQLKFNKKIQYYKKQDNKIIQKKVRKTNKLSSIYYYKKNTLKNVLLRMSKKNNKKKKRDNNIELYKILNNWKFKFRDISYKRYPLIGMRIECSGPTKKGRRTQTHLYNEWVDFYTLPGKMPLVTIMNDIKYWQTYGLTRRAAIGIKIWMHFYPASYSQEKKKLLNK